MGSPVYHDGDRSLAGGDRSLAGGGRPVLAAVRSLSYSRVKRVARVSGYGETVWEAVRSLRRSGSKSGAGVEQFAVRFCDGFVFPAGVMMPPIAPPR